MDSVKKSERDAARTAARRALCEDLLVFVAVSKGEVDVVDGEVVPR